MAGRFIKLYEQVTQWGWYKDGNTFRLFIHLLLKANYDDSVFEGVQIHRGQVVTSLPRLANETGLTVMEIRTAIKHLILTGEITALSYSKFRVITIVKYDDFQSSTGKLTVNQQASNRQLTVNQQHNRNNIESIEEKEDIEVEKRKPATSRFTPPTKEEIYDFCLENELGIDVDYLFDYYTAKGWKIGKETMKDWKAAVRNWARRDKKDQIAKPAPVRQVAGQQYQQRDYSGEQDYWMNRMIADIKGGSADG